MTSRALLLVAFAAMTAGSSASLCWHHCAQNSYSFNRDAGVRACEYQCNRGYWPVRHLLAVPADSLPRIDRGTSSFQACMYDCRTHLGRAEQRGALSMCVRGCAVSANQDAMLQLAPNADQMGNRCDYQPWHPECNRR